MKDLTYRMYLDDPAVREQIEREVRRARAQAVQQLIVAPLVRALGRLFRRAPCQPATLQLRAEAPWNR